jgi:hypothetical protein
MLRIDDDGLDFRPAEVDASSQRARGRHAVILRAFVLRTHNRVSSRIDRNVAEDR